MRRIRIVVALLALALALPAALLVRRSLEGVAIERTVRHRTVAERVFDEMERSLSRFLEVEEERPWDDYRRVGIDEGRLPFVVGHFEEEPGGRIRVPGEALLGADAARVQAVVDREREARPQETAAGEQAPGTTTVTLSPLRREQIRGLGYAVEPSAPPQTAAVPSAEAVPQQKRAYDAIQSLNRGARERQARERRVLEEAPSVLADEDAAARVAADEAEDDRFDAVKAGRASAPSEALAPFARELARPKREKATALESLAQDARRVRIAVDPLHGRTVEGDLLLLARTVWIGERGVRQGLVLDRAALADWLRAEVLDPLGLPGAEISFGAAQAAGEYVFRHRFGEPFQDVTASLGLAPLAGGRGEGPIYLLAALFGLVAAAGLLAVHRTAAVTVEFAERRSNFAASVSHELKTPLTSIRMYAEMLRDGIVPDEAKRHEYHSTITAESERLGRLIDNVLEFSRLEKGTREMNLLAGDLGAVVAELTERVRPIAMAAGFALEVEIEPGLPPVRFERDALLQVLFNLVDNAVKYAGDTDERRIRIACRAADGGVELCVRDHGPGVPPRQLPRVFEPFTRVEDELTRRTKGTGLGLALVKGLSERMGAQLRAGNAEPSGFEVRITFG